MRPKHESLQSDQLFYCFVDFGQIPIDRPTTFVLPSKIVAQVLRAAHQAWLAHPGAHGQPRNDSSVRRLLPDYSYAYRPDPAPYTTGWMNEYREAWHLLGLD